MFCVTSLCWQKVTLCVCFLPTRRSEEAFARVIRGNPTIQRFETEHSFHFESFGIIASALATLPALESAILGHGAEYVEEEEGDLEDLHVLEHD